MFGFRFRTLAVILVFFLTYFEIEWPFFCLNGPPDTFVVVVVAVAAAAAAIVSIHHAQYVPRWTLCTTPMTRKYACVTQGVLPFQWLLNLSLDFELRHLIAEDFDLSLLNR